jgi:hypothetical protein
MHYSLKIRHAVYLRYLNHVCCFQHHRSPGDHLLTITYKAFQLEEKITIYERGFKGQVNKNPSSMQTTCQIKHYMSYGGICLQRSRLPPTKENSNGSLYEHKKPGLKWSIQSSIT